MITERHVRWGLIATAVVATALVLLDVDGPVRTVISLAFMLLAPGLTLSLLMGPMSMAARALVTITASVAMALLVSLLLLATGTWSGGLGQVVLASFVLVVCIKADLRADSEATSTTGAVDPPSPEAAAPPPFSPAADANTSVLPRES